MYLALLHGESVVFVMLLVGLALLVECFSAVCLEGTTKCPTCFSMSSRLATLNVRPTGSIIA